VRGEGKASAAAARHEEELAVRDLHEVTHFGGHTGRTGHKAHAHAGIGEGTGITAGEAAVNADFWACCAADSAGALTDGEITRRTGGALGRLPTN